MCVRLRFGFRTRCEDVFRKENSKKTSGWFPIFRWAQQGSLSRTWARRGTRPAAVCQRQFSLYLDVFFGVMKNTPRRKRQYRFRQGACCPAKDKAVGLILPQVNMDMMELHLAEVSSHVSDGCHAVVVLDCASWHTTEKLVVPSNVSLLPLPLPPHSPELNPVEQVWQQLRKIKLSNIAYEDYDSILDASCEAWNMFVDEEGNVKKLCSRNWAK